MIPFRALLNLLLMLALVVGGLGPASAGHQMPQPHGTSAEAGPPCHAEPAAEPEPDIGVDCCGDNACTCDCLHLSPLLVDVPRLPSSLPSGANRLLLRDIASPSPALRPPLRPPIA